MQNICAKNNYSVFLTFLLTGVFPAFQRGYGPPESFTPEEVLRQGGDLGGRGWPHPILV